MASRASDIPTLVPLESPAERYARIRSQSVSLCFTLEPEDFAVQSADFVSPTKWHLAHTTWFFETFILKQFVEGYEVFDEQYHYLFNSYYNSQGTMHPRPKRGLLSRPTAKTIGHYRDHVNEQMLELLGSSQDPQVMMLTNLGLNHEQQHQELMLTDIKHVFSENPLKPAFIKADYRTRKGALPALDYERVTGRVRKIGAAGKTFCFDNETPRHQVMLADFEMARRLISNGEYREFIKDGGYSNPDLWLADGWAWVQENGITGPLYWADGQESHFTLSGAMDIDEHAPVCHVSFYEADAFARWAGARLPSEAEWEVVASQVAVAGTFVDDGLLHPQPLAGATENMEQIYGDVWEWTSSPYVGYPGFKPLSGSLGEYNGKFMANQMVCRGGSCVTPTGHIRPTYRNFFYPQDRWQFFGIRLARDVEPD